MHESAYDFEKDKEDFRKFCKEHGEKMPVFMQDWYLDATIADGAEWRVICIKENNQIVAVFPFQYSKVKKKFGLTLYKIENTFQQARAGIWIDYANREAPCKRENFLIDVVNQVIDRLPYYDSFDILFSPDFTDWSPFYWRGFQQTTRYSYIIKPERYNGDKEKLIGTFRYDRRKTIKKAELSYTIDKDMTGDEFYNFLQSTYKEKGKKLLYTYEQFHKIDQGVEKHNAKIIYRARDLEENTLAAVYMLCDNKRSYWMFTAFRQQIKGGQELLTWAGMKDCLEQNIIYDFEGSMIPGVSHYIREYNAEKEAYFRIFNISGRIKALEAIGTVWRIFMKPWRIIKNGVVKCIRKVRVCIF